MPWAYICKLLGPGLLWSKTKEQLADAITLAEKDGQHAAADHLRGMLELRNKVMFD